MKNSKTLKKVISVIVILAIMIPMLPFSLPGTKAASSTSYSRQMESLDRGLVAVKTSSGVFLSWRLLGTESYSTKFNVYRDGVKIASNISDSTNYLDANGSSSSNYYVRSVVSGSEVTESDKVTPWTNNYKDVPISKPANTTLNGETVTYSANDATVADVDGDGAYEIILKWDPSNSKDNSQSGYTSNVYVDCYEMNGTRRWRIDLGKNIRAGAHYTQIVAYDLNGDGKAEVAMKTADGTVAGDGSVIGDSSKDYRNSSGYILSGPEYLTLFEGATGKELVTIDYNPQRGTVSSWGDSYGNRVDRFLAGVAYLDGKTPSLIMCRGYYTRAVIVAYEYKAGKLNQEWVFDTNSSGNSAYAGQGNHNLSIADVDGDGKDEIVYGSAVIDDNGKGLYSTGNGHGDALHVGDFDPTIDGLEIFQVHEEKGSSIESIQMRKAGTGATIWSKKLSKDIGRGIIMNIGPDFYPYVTLASSGNYYNSKGNSVTSAVSGLGMNFATYWDGDLYREGLDGTTIRKWDWNNSKVVTVLTGSNVHSNNSTKATPSLSADILGDWREEVIWPTSDDKALRIYTTTNVTQEKLYTLMHDSQYRLSIAWQNVAYNQPPHTSYYVGPDMPTPTKPNMYTVGSYSLKTVSSSTTQTEATQTTTQATSGTIASGWYYIKNVNSNKYLEVENNSGYAGANVCQGTGTGETGQKWYVGSTSDGYYTFKSALGAYNLDVYGWGATDGTNIGIWDANGLDCQKFEIRQISNGQYAILTKLTNSEKGLDVYNISTEDGANVCQWSYWGGNGQLWRFEACSYSDSTSSTTQATTQAPTQAPTTQTPTQAPTQSGNTGSSSSWNFSDSTYNGLGNISSTTTVGNLTLTASSSKTMLVKNSPVTVNGTSYTYALALSGGGSTSYRSVKVPVSGNSTIKVILKSSGSSERTLVMTDSSGKSLATATAKTSASEATFTYSGSSGYVYLYSSGSGIDLYKIQVDSSSQAGSGSSSGSSATQTPTTQAPTQAPTTQAATTQASSSTTAKKHNFTTDGTSSSFLTFSSKKNIASGKGSYTYEGLSLTKCLKVESATTLKFTTTKANAKLVMVVNAKSSGGALKVSGPSNSTIGSLSTTVEVREITLGSAGTYTISKSSKECYIYYIKVIE